jgi:hypothetical protein
MTHRIEPGQEYLACRPAASMPGEHYARIRVTSRPYPGWRGDGQVDIETVAPDGRGLRLRSITVRQLHATAGRKTGYRLVQHADGTPATEGGSER